MSNLYKYKGKTYCGEWMTPVTNGNKQTGTMTFRAMCGFAIVGEKCNNEKYFHPHPGVENTHK